MEFRRKFAVTALLATLLAISSYAGTPTVRYLVNVDPISVQGGWDYEKWLDLAKQCADRLLECAPDRYGSRHTPLWLSIVDPETCGMIEEKPSNWQTYWDAEDYVMTAQGCNLYRDMPTLRAFKRLSELTGEGRYKQAVDRYLQFYLDELPSATTGLFPWGEHMSYNTLRDKIVATRHEMEYNLPDWELLWEVNPEAVRREIEAIYRINIWDKENFLYDRHANYFTGEFDPAPVRGAYIKHSGLFAYSFLFLYSKTHDPRYLEWARGISNVYWSRRNPETGLVPGYISGTPPSMAQIALAYDLLEGSFLFPDEEIQRRALGMVDSFIHYGFDREKGRFASGLNTATGKPVGNPAPSSWGSYSETALYCRLYACLDAYKQTGTPGYLDILKRCLKEADDEPLPAKVVPDAVGGMLDLFVRTYRETGDRFYLRQARKLGEWTAENLIRNGLILEYSGGCVYNNYRRPGQLLQAWLSLYEEEKAAPVHWSAPASIRPGEGSFEIRAETGPGTVVEKVHWKLPDGSEDISIPSRSGGEMVFPVPVPGGRPVIQGPLDFRFLSQDGTELDSGTVILAANADGPKIGPWELPDYVAEDEPLCGKVKVTDPSGIESVVCHYRVGDSEKTRSVECSGSAGKSDVFEFAIPPDTGRWPKPIRVQVEATGNPGWPVSRLSEEREVPTSYRVSFDPSSATGATADVPWGKSRFSIGLVSGRPKSVIDVAFFSVNPTGTGDDLPEVLVGPFFRILSGGSLEGVRLEWTVSPEQVESVLPSTLALYRCEMGRWHCSQSGEVSGATPSLTFQPEKDTLFVAGARPRLLARRTFNGALLSSPAVARISHDGQRAIILNTRSYDGALYALDHRATTIWKYDFGDMQPFPTVADLNGDGLDEIAVGGPCLTVLSPSGELLWKAPLRGAACPAIGDLDGDGQEEVVVATANGSIAAYSASGAEEWRVESAQELGIPALARLAADANLSVVVGGERELIAVSSKGSVLWKVPLHGEMMVSPAVANLDDDFADEILCYTRTDAAGTLSAFSETGELLWETTVSREPDWCPVVADFLGTGALQILAQATDPRKLAVFDRKGQWVETLPTTGRTLQTPVPVDLDGNGRLDVLTANDLSCRIWGLRHDGAPLWSYTPRSFTCPGAKVKGAGSLLVADLDGNGFLEVVGGDDETWLNILATETRCDPYAVVSGQFHGNSCHTGCYTLSNRP